MEVKLQPFDLQKSGSESKIVLSMTLRVGILKNQFPLSFVAFLDKS